MRPVAGVAAVAASAAAAAGGSARAAVAAAAAPGVRRAVREAAAFFTEPPVTRCAVMSPPHVLRAPAVPGMVVAGRACSGAPGCYRVSAPVPSPCSSSSAPPPLPADYPLCRASTLAFSGHAGGVLLLGAVARALEGAGADLASPSTVAASAVAAAPALRGVVWGGGAGTGAADCASFAVQIFGEGGGRVLVEFLRVGGDASVFWSLLRAVAGRLAAAGAGGAFTVTPLVPLGVDAVRRDYYCVGSGGSMPVVDAGDVAPLVGLVGAGCVEGARMAAALAAAAARSAEGASACVTSGLVAALGGLCVAAAAARTGGCDGGEGVDVEAATAAAIALAELCSSAEGRSALLGGGDGLDGAVVAALLALADDAACNYTARALRREACRAVGALRDGGDAPAATAPRLVRATAC